MSKSQFKSESLQFLFREKNNKGAEFTVKSKNTGKDYTFSIRRSLYNDRWYTHVNVEKGYMNFVRIGTYFNGSITNKREVVDTPAAKAISWLLIHVEHKKFEKLDDSVELLHIGSCLVCGKALTDAISIQYGIGPICRNLK